MADGPPATSRPPIVNPYSKEVYLSVGDANPVLWSTGITEAMSSLWIMVDSLMLDGLCAGGWLLSIACWRVATFWVRSAIVSFMAVPARLFTSSSNSAL